MSSYLIKFATKKIFNETQLNKFGTEDPYHEEIVVNPDLTPERQIKKRVKKRSPAGISVHDQKVYEKVKRRAYRMDLLFNLCGVRIGLSNVIGAIPILGDLLNIYLSLMIFRLCCKVEGGLPVDVQLKMVVNIVADFAIGLIPIVGDFVDILYKANSRNLLLLEKHLVQVGEVNLGKRDRVDGVSEDDVRKYLKDIQVPEAVNSVFKQKKQ